MGLLPPAGLAPNPPPPPPPRAGRLPGLGLAARRGGLCRARLSFGPRSGLVAAGGRTSALASERSVAAQQRAKLRRVIS